MVCVKCHIPFGNSGQSHCVKCGGTKGVKHDTI